MAKQRHADFSFQQTQQKENENDEVGDASAAKPRKPSNVEDASRSRTHPEGGVVVSLLMCHYYGWWGRGGGRGWDGGKGCPFRKRKHRSLHEVLEAQ